MLPARSTSSMPPGWVQRLPFFYGWLVVGGLVVIGAVNSGYYWMPPLFVIPMQEELGWSRTSIFAAVTVRGLIGAFVSPFFGALLDRPGGAIRLAASSAVIGGLSTMPIAWVQSEWQFLLLFGVLGGLSQVGQSTAILGAVLPRWFVHGRGNAMATATIGMPLGAFGTPLIAGALILLLGWRNAWLAMGALILVIGCIPAFLFHRQPEDIGLRPDNGTPASKGSRPIATPDLAQSMTGPQAIRTRSFWILTLGIAAGSLATGAMPASLIPMFVDRGLALPLALLGVSLHGIVSLATRPLWAWATHRFHIRTVLLVIAAYGALAAHAPFFLQGDPLVLYAGIISVSIGGLTTTNAMIWPAYFGRAHLGAITGFVRTAQNTVGAFAPLTIPFLYERLGDYAPGIWMVSAAWATLGVCMLLAQRPSETRLNLHL
ncbi:MAG: MFS transporter [Chloroflexota bacterium]